MYEKELLQELARYETMKEANKDEHDLRQQVNEDICASG